MSGLLGALSGLGQGMAQTGNTLFNNELDKMKEARLNAIRQQERAEDRQFRKEDFAMQREAQLTDMQTQRDWSVEDRDFAAQHATKLAGMRSSSGSASTRLDPRIGIIDKEISGIEKLLESTIDGKQRDELLQHRNMLIEQRRVLGGLPGITGGLLTGDVSGQTESTGIIDRMANAYRQNREEARLNDLEIRDRNAATITNPNPNRPTLLHETVIPQSARNNRSRYDVGTDVNSIDERRLLGIAISELSSDDFRNMNPAVKNAIIERLPTLRNQLPPSLLERAEELR